MGILRGGLFLIKCGCGIEVDNMNALGPHLIDNPKHIVMDTIAGRRFYFKIDLLRTDPEEQILCVVPLND